MEVGCDVLTDEKFAGYASADEYLRYFLIVLRVVPRKVLAIVAHQACFECSVPFTAGW